MMPLLSEQGIAHLADFVEPGVLCVFDFDGTLAPIVAQPDEAVLPPRVRTRLLALQKLTRVAILTGRGLSDIRLRMDFEPDYVIGNHGLEGLPDSGPRLAQFEALCDGWRDALRGAFGDATRFDPALMLEDKQISLSVHYRQVRDSARTEAALLALFDTLTPAPRVIGGKQVYNLLPQAAGDKGTAFAKLMTLSGADKALYVGDDVTDEDVFRLRRSDLLSIRVGASEDSAAAFFLRRHTDMLALLDELIARLDPVRASP